MDRPRDWNLSTEEADSLLGQKGLHLGQCSAALPRQVAGIPPIPKVSWDAATSQLVSA